MQDVPAICVWPGTTNPLRIQDVPAGVVTEGHARITGGLRTTCATELVVVAKDYFGAIPDRQSEWLVAGHEAGGFVTESGIDGLEPGTLVTLKVRRSRPGTTDRFCCLGRPDLGRPSEIHEAGMFRMDGYHRSTLVVPQDLIVPLPGTFPRHLLTLPDLVSCVWKAIREALAVRAAKLNGTEAPTQLVVVLGAGAAGLCAARIFSSMGLRVVVIDILPETSRKARLATLAGDKVVYLENTRSLDPNEIAKAVASFVGGFGEADILFEASGLHYLADRWTDCLAPAGVVAYFGIPHGQVTRLETDYTTRQISRMLRGLGEIYSINSSHQDWLWAIDEITAGVAFYEQFLFPTIPWGDVGMIRECFRDPETIKPRILLPGEKA